MRKFNLRSILKELLVTAVILFIVANVLSYLRQPELSSTKLAKIEAKLLDGSAYEMQEGKPLLVHFWGTWCPICKLEAANIQRVSEAYEVLSIAVNSGTDEALEVYMQEAALNFKVINDKEGKWARDFNVEVYPTTFIYDAKGELKFVEVGYTTTAGLLGRLKYIDFTP